MKPTTIVALTFAFGASLVGLRYAFETCPETECDTGALIRSNFETSGGSTHVNYMTDLVRRTSRIEASQRQITLRTWERPDTSAEFDYFEHVESTSFDILDLDSAGLNSLYLLGEARNGECLIEKWTILEESGGYRTSWPQADPSTFGALSVAPVLPGAFVAGGTYVPPASRAQQGLTIEKEELYRGFDFIQPEHVEADPEGRFCVVADPGAAEVVQVVFYDPPVLLTLASGAASCLDSIDVMELLSEGTTAGRSLLVYTDGDGAQCPHDYVLLTDEDLDGDFEAGPVTLTDSEYEGLGFPDDWEEDFVNYGSFGFPHEYD